ncbi:MAG: dihydroxyacetone kinase phosphoryl donor subunit DhaM [Treponema sp.]|nr:dihydroxyacetone kinase phosphoryl donor subunit DhaM [Treponema sp.]
MVSLLLLSHSLKIVEGAKDLALQMGGEANIIAVGGTKVGTLGADYDSTFEAMHAAAEQGEVIVLADLGSARLTGQMAKEALDSELQTRVYLCDAALVEGALIAAIAISAEQSAEEVLKQLEEYILPKDE